ncbi:hypothetical protein N7507_004652 [Penicillium longicatenatum]|nr:hypothetical protein N7507_004652 [Penicillium longicatenatum]
MGLVGVFSSHTPSPSMEEAYSTRGPYGLDVLYDPDFASVDIVFVHGLTGNRESTWTDKQSKIFWPKQLLPRDLPNARIWTFGYDADIIGALKTASSNTLRDHGKSLMHDLSLARLMQKSHRRPLIFVAHSLGGLVTEQTLVCARESPHQHHKDLFESTFAITFMGTPHVGSAQANWATPLTRLASVLRRTNSEIVQVLEPGSEMLANLQQGFHTMLEDYRRNHSKTIEMFCFYEELAVRGIGKIVEDHSAILSGCSNRSIHADHMEMTKFGSNRDPGYVAVSQQLWLWIYTLEESKAQAQAAPVSTTQLQPHQQQHTIDSGGGPMFLGSVTAGRDFINSTQTR